MRAVVHVNNTAHQGEHAAWMKRGLERHGFRVMFAHWDRPEPAELVVVWGWKQANVTRAALRAGAPILVAERGHLPDRMKWTSCGLNGLGNRAVYAKVEDGGARWRRNFGHLEQPWSDRGDHTLVCGQVRGDAALYGCDFHAWAQRATDGLRAKGHHVVYRPHPLSLRLQNDRWHPRGARLSEAPLAEDLARASLVVTYNSTVGVETVLAGVPTVTCDAGAMAWDVTTHDIDAAPVRPERADWAHRMAWTSWLRAEIEAGDMWEHLRHELPACATAP